MEGLGEQKCGAEGVVGASNPQEALGWLFPGVFFPTALDVVKVLLQPCSRSRCLLQARQRAVPQQVMLQGSFGAVMTD